MYTFCPNCHTIFRLTPRHLSKAGGQTRCGECRTAYKAVDYLFEDLDSTREARQLSRQQAEDLALTAEQEPVAESQTVDHESEPAPGSEPLSRLEPAADWTQSSRKRSDLFGGIAVVFLVLILAAQWVFFKRAELASEPALRSGMEQFCKFLHCDLPMQVDLAQLELLSRDIRRHPRVDEALLVNATLSNNADFTQPYPVIEVSFTDLGGNPVAVRRFRAIEYVHDSYTLKRGMAPGEPVPVVLEILDPGEVAASYQFGFL